MNFFRMLFGAPNNLFIFKVEEVMNARRISKWLGFATLGLAALLMRAGAETGGSPTKIQGVLIDEKCSSSAQTRIVSGAGEPHLEGGIVWGYTHTRKCALMP